MVETDAMGTLRADSYDRGDRVIEFDAEELDADLLYDLTNEVALFGDETRVARLEIERRHIVNNDNYVPAFTLQTVTMIATSLLIVRAARQAMGERDSVRVIERFGELLNDETDGAIDERIAKKLELDALSASERGEPIHLIDALRGEQRVAYNVARVEDHVEAELTELDPSDFE